MLKVAPEAAAGRVVLPLATPHGTKWRALGNSNTGEFDAVATNGVLQAADGAYCRRAI